MKYFRPSNIREFVWRVIDTDIALKKDLSRGLINVRSLANYIIREYQLSTKLDSVVSAVRRYDFKTVSKSSFNKVTELLVSAKVRTISSVASLSLKKNESVHQKIAQVLPNVNYSAGDIFRVVEAAKMFKVFFDAKDFDLMQQTFGKQNIISVNKRLAMVEMNYPDALEQTPGVFSAISNELASNDISIIDAVISGNEHVIVVEGDKILKAFELVHNLCQQN